MTIKLSPPWFTFANEIKYTYGMSPYVHVEDLVQVGNNYELPITVCNNKIATALRQILPLNRDFGGVIVNVIIYTSSKMIVPIENIEYTPETLADTICTALYRNSLFVGTILTEGKFNPEQIDILGQVVVIIKKYIIQFYNDDISDICNNYNQIAAIVFSDISNLSYAVDLDISFSTEDSNCIKSSYLYCRGKNPCNHKKKIKGP